jgi:hypothetical protein
MDALEKRWARLAQIESTLAEKAALEATAEENEDLEDPQEAAANVSANLSYVASPVLYPLNTGENDALLRAAKEGSIHVVAEMLKRSDANVNKVRDSTHSVVVKLKTLLNHENYLSVTECV